MPRPEPSLCVCVCGFRKGGAAHAWAAAVLKSYVPWRFCAHYRLEMLESLPDSGFLSRAEGSKGAAVEKSSRTAILVGSERP